jgi:hypothetical protein
MNRFRTISGFVRLLIALFWVAQLSGVVSSPRANAQTIPTALAHTHHQHTHDNGDERKAHDRGGHSGNLADTCCALHAYFSGVVPPVAAIETVSVAGKRLAAGPDDLGLGVPSGRLDRPPRPPR